MPSLLRQEASGSVAQKNVDGKCTSIACRSRFYRRDSRFGQSDDFDSFLFGEVPVRAVVSPVSMFLQRNKSIGKRLYLVWKPLGPAVLAARLGLPVINGAIGLHPCALWPASAGSGQKIGIRPAKRMENGVVSCGYGAAKVRLFWLVRRQPQQEIGLRQQVSWDQAASPEISLLVGKLNNGKRLSPIVASAFLTTPVAKKTLSEDSLGPLESTTT
jgi:hypothetical protein